MAVTDQRQQSTAARQGHPLRAVAPEWYGPRWLYGNWYSIAIDHLHCTSLPFFAQLFLIGASSQ